MKKLYRDRWNKKLGGVCGGLGAYFNIDPAFIRFLFIISLVCSMGLTFILYLVGWILMPAGPAAYIQPKGRQLYRSRKDRKIGGICAALARYFRIDPTWMRIAFVVVTLLTGFFPGLVVYFLAGLAIPEKRLP